MNPLSPAVPDPNRADLNQQLQAAQQELVAAEKALAEEQATINAFRMQARLKLGATLDELLELHAQWQALLIARRLEEAGLPFDPSDPFGWEDSVAAAGDELDVDGTLAGELAGWQPSARDAAAEKRLFRELARRFHPDLGGGDGERAYRTSIMAAVNEAYANNDLETLRDLAGEPDPAAILERTASRSAPLRRLQERLHACQRRQRKVVRQLQALRQETSARLWRRAMVVEAGGGHWWEEVALELATEAARLRADLETWQTESGRQ
ncbi:MAG: J domain-containing protein [Anaerolineales bacterium]|nr:J domain-containing protein [Anaerolineales bacterium]